MRRFRLPLALLVLLPLLVVGCDSNDPDDEGIDLAPLRAAFGCNTFGQISVGQTVNGTLAASDCQLPDDSYVDYYAFRLTSSTNVQIDLESSAFDAFLFLASSAGVPIASDDDGGSGFNARITRQLSAGVYVIFANSLDEGDTGAYTLRLASN